MTAFAIHRSSSSCRAAAALSAAVVLAGCAAPSIHIDNPSRHRCYLDGVREQRSTIPFRYYGQSRLDVVPADIDGQPDWDLRPLSLVLAVEPPASPWLFPFDFVVEVANRAWAGDTGRDLIATVAPPPTPLDQQVQPDVRPAGVERVRERADAARIAR